MRKSLYYYCSIQQKENPWNKYSGMTFPLNFISRLTSEVSLIFCEVFVKKGRVI